MGSGGTIGKPTMLPSRHKKSPGTPSRGSRPAARSVASSSAVGVRAVATSPAGCAAASVLTLGVTGSSAVGRTAVASSPAGGHDLARTLSTNDPTSPVPRGCITRAWKGVQQTSTWRV
eukprot:scaffold42680_cov67-Phaeocystis_antarctica.AAC.8